MVQHDTSSSSDENTGPNIPDIPAKGISTGKFRLVGWAVDTTGRRLIDEIVQIAGYTPNDTFSQYIMPFSDLSPFYSRKHNIRVFNTIRYRRLKDMRTGQFLKTKSEISALTDFVQWLEKVKGDAEGVILIFYELKKSVPGMLLEALRRNNLLERFEKICKGFANGYSIAKTKCQSSTKTHNLKVMVQILLGRENIDSANANDRASAVYDIAVHLAQGEREEIEGSTNKITTGTEPDLIEMVCPYTNPISAEEEEIEGFKVLLQRQNTFRPVFRDFLRASASERQHASRLRRLLAMNNINYDKLKEAYEQGAKDGLDKILKEEIANAKEEDLNELLDILDRYFDPDKQPVKPKTPWRNNKYNRGPRPRSFGNRRSNSRSKGNSDSKGEECVTDNNTSTEINTSTDNTASTETSPRSEEKVKVEVPTD
ncbi:maternal protein exuperantia [Sitophilus oryzae]|uniref:Maternal protein exuperantia n=1 Tax=Sitophilus oryzae TaxID=7048 RepID=A0A6J2YKS1_SITOR|nr:maternal protein exuperantia [Sitophilus oryzae]XP_030763996.1 maternal protein exuperantia [Sitophilus oryzae]XP_030763997.1 maternal protein exuperantia [Sitophilus oryzae]